MNIISLSVKRPVTVIMFFLLCVLMGVLSWTKLPRELFPPLAFPQLTVVTVYPNAAPEEIENLITKIIEEAIGTVKNLKRVSSISKEGTSLVTAEFSWNTNMNFASLWVREKLDQIKARLPPESGEPLVIAFNPFSEPVVLLNITGTMSSSDLLHLCKKIIKDRLEKTEGVASVEISGGEEKEILVEVDQGRLQALQISLSRIVDAIRDTNINYPAGTAKEQVMEYLVRTIGEYRSVEDIGRTVIETAEYQSKKYPFRRARDTGENTYKKSPRTIKLSDLAHISWSLKDRTSYSRYNSIENIAVAVRKRSEAHTIRTSENIQRTVVNLRTTLKPHGVSIDIVYDQAEFIKKSISGLTLNAIMGGILAFVVIFFFLKSLRMALIISAAIPVSILISVSCMYLFDLTLNMMSLGGLALGVGMLVDNAIVVIENISRRHSKGEPGKEASVSGAREVAASIVSSTLTSVAVFLPLIFVVGIAGQIFKELSLTVIFSLSASLLVALSLIPRLASTARIRTASSDRGGTLPFADTFRTCIRAIIERKKQFLFGVTALFIVCLALISVIEKSFLPAIDQGQFLVHINLPVGTRLDITNSITKRIEDVLHTIPQIKSIMTQVGSASAKAVESLGQNQAQVVVELYRSRKTVKHLKKIRSTQEIIHDVRTAVSGLALDDVNVTFTMQDSLFKSIAEKSAPVVIEVKGTDMEQLKSMTEDISAQLHNIEGLVNIRDDRPLPSPETRINVDKDKAAVSNLSVADIARTGLIGLKGMVASTFKQEGTEYDIRVRLAEKDRNNLASLENLLVYAPGGYNLYLKQVANIEAGKGPSQIKRIDQQRTITVHADLAGVSLRKVAGRVTEIIDIYQDMPGYTVMLSGETEKIRESFISLISALIFALILVYMIMAAQFESLYQPFIILFTIPLALIGVVIAFILTGTSINAISMMGFIILGGIVVNNGIVLIDFINQLRARGVSLIDAVITSCETRLRPIIMTMSTTVLGLLPIALGIGEGAELRTPMAITVIGGLLFSTVFTLGVIPVIYILFEERRQTGNG